MDREAYRTQGLLRSYEGAESDEERQRLEAEIIGLGGAAVKPLAEAVRKSPVYPNNNSKATGVIVGVVFFLLGLGAVIEFDLNIYLMIPFSLAAMLIAAVLGHSGPSTSELLPFRLLLRIDDVRAIEPLVDALGQLGSTALGDEVVDRLTYLLPRLTRRDSYQIDEATRAVLYTLLDVSPSAALMKSERAIAFQIAIIKGLVQIGDPNVRQQLKAVKENAGDERVVHIAEKGIEELNRRASRRKP